MNSTLWFSLSRATTGSCYVFFVIPCATLMTYWLSITLFSSNCFIQTANMKELREFIHAVHSQLNVLVGLKKCNLWTLLSLVTVEIQNFIWMEKHEPLITFVAYL